MKILSVANEKGGVGKTVLAANLAWELSRKDYCVLVVDLDQQCDLTKLLYREANPPQHDIVDLLKGQCKVLEACSKVKDNLHIIPGSKNLKFYKRKGETRLRNLLKDEYLKEVDIIIIDNPPSTNEITLLGYVAATDVLIVTESESFSTENIGTFMEDLMGIKETMNPNLSVVGIVANKIDQRRTLTKQALNELRRVFGKDLLQTYISNNTAVPNSIQQRKTLRELGWSNPALSQIMRVSAEIEGRLGL